MQNRQLIEIYVVEIQDLLRRGEYAKCYARAKDTLSLCENTAIESETRRRLTVLAAKSAYSVSRFDEALALCEAAEELLGTVNLPSRHRYSFECALIRANMLRRQGKLHEALAVIERHEGEVSAGVSPELVSEKLLIEGACRFYLDELPRAEESLEAALGIAIQHGDSRVKARVLTMLGLVAQRKGLHEAALEFLNRAKEICRVNGDRYGEAAAALNTGILLYRRGRFSSAARNVERARAIFESIEWRIGVCRSLLAEGNIARCRGDFAAAVRFYRDAGRLAEGNGFARERALACEFMGDVHFERARYEAAERCYREGLAIAASMAPAGDIVVEINRRLGELYLSREEVSSALPILRAALRLSVRLDD